MNESISIYAYKKKGDHYQSKFMHPYQKTHKFCDSTVGHLEKGPPFWFFAWPGPFLEKEHHRPFLCQISYLHHHLKYFYDIYVVSRWTIYEKPVKNNQAFRMTKQTQKNQTMFDCPITFCGHCIVMAESKVSGRALESQWLSPGFKLGLYR